MTTYSETAIGHVEAVKAARVHLDELHRQFPPDRRRIAETYDNLRQGLKLAEVHALLSIGQQVEQLNEQVANWLALGELVEDDDQEPAPVVQLVPSGDES